MGKHSLHPIVKKTQSSPTSSAPANNRLPLQTFLFFTSSYLTIKHPHKFTEEHSTNFAQSHRTLNHRLNCQWIFTRVHM
ncbi:hypothetical protein L1987_50728 [Smallanthus sonchifolius]|uniref:Uncharacterized protein n=1 Tax=Smallanthus sonchifolius TaxID=185202 RepID=A0ACB9EN10_9ASTR|nr:hypothetical protein L1987_50728 [Smallanthus sonchifolius]